MKRIILSLAVVAAMLTACNQKTGYTINGTAEGAADGDTVYLQKMVDKKYVNIDSTTIQGGAFAFKGNVEKPVVRFVRTQKDDAKYVAPVILENAPINVTLANVPKVTGTPDNELYSAFVENTSNLETECHDMIHVLQSDSTLTDEKRTELQNTVQQKYDEYQETIKKFITDNTGNLAGAYALGKLGSRLFDLDELKGLMAKVPAEMGDVLTETGLTRFVDANEKTAVGQKYTDFAIKDTEGKDVKLSDYVAKNKYTLVDFWASWCVPCRHEMPNVKRNYEAYKSKGFGVVGVSTDKDLDAWKKAIDDLGLTWPQTSDKESDFQATKMYGIVGIPATILIDQEGTIVARDLRDEDLTNKLKELFK